ncbi:DUF2950 domain-containing protein [Pseudomonas sp. PCH199]|uniref:DUF2950 domain-containing protein n=1 Tax=unclassified Pseudomonas TaxID=196821 RepID=UPI000BD88407|nr:MULTISPECIES: DUF2950 domain-containing protein [unclassified Pseudomonas]MCW8278428.1 DUF2950 domain-containing protein [Pseudomonas sp. PCH199]PAM81396.1 hypothetical protein CES87_25595 [Pseudomonas sp. ERMR1:02]
MDLLPHVLAIAAGLAWSCIATAQQAFPTPEKAAQAFVQALGTEHADQARLTELLGDDWRNFIPRGGVQRSDVDAFLKLYREQHSIEKPSDRKAVLSVGSEHWTLPIPMIKAANGWRFDIKAGSAEVRARRIGSNELATVQSVLAYHDAQMDYASVDRDGDGALEYAQKIFSTPGQHDGLYWADDDSGQISPLGPLFGKTKAGDDWHGYHFRILEGQGPSAPGGAYSYLIGDKMSRGFALIAWPAKYDDTGVMSFMISHDGQVFEKDLGPDGEKLAQSMKRFDPDDSWKEMTVDQKQ